MISRHRISRSIADHDVDVDHPDLDGFNKFALGKRGWREEENQNCGGGCAHIFVLIFFASVNQHIKTLINGKEDIPNVLHPNGREGRWELATTAAADSR